MNTQSPRLSLGRSFLYSALISAAIMCIVTVATSTLAACAPRKDVSGASGIVEKTSAAAVGREIARGAVYVAAEALATLDQQCAVLALDRKDQPLAAHCADVYKSVRPAILVAALSVDAWESVASKREDVTCIVLEASSRLALLMSELQNKGSPAIPIVADAIKLATSLGQCPARKDGGT